MRDLARRHQQIKELLGSRPMARTGELAEALGTSEVTLRRDLRYLESIGAIVREHGGARLATDRSQAEENFAVRELRSPEAKAWIGSAAADLVRDGWNVACNDGTTVMAFAAALRDRGVSCTATTNALNVAVALSESTSLEVFALGGKVREASFATYSLNQPMLRATTFDAVVLGVESMSAAGVTVDHPYDFEYAQTLVEQSHRVIVVADSTKWGRVGRYQFAGWDQIDVLVTENAPPESLRSVLRDVELIHK